MNQRLKTLSREASILSKALALPPVKAETGIWLFDHLVRAYQDDARQSKVKQFRCPSIDYHLEDGGLLNRNVSGLSAFQYLVDKIGKAAPFALEARAVAQQSTRVAELSEPEH